MNRPVILLSLLIGLSMPAASPAATAPARAVTSFDADWRFLQADSSGADKPDFADTTWRKLDVPHDWSIEGAFDRTAPSGPSGAFLPTGIGWYRRHFSLADTDRGRRFFIQFDGVMANSDVWINGYHLGQRPFGYVSFQYDMTGHLNFGNQENVLVVRADNSEQPASRWYSGAGIYRHVRLITTESVHLDINSAFVSTPTVAADQATIRVTATVVNESSSPQTVELVVPYANPDGTSVATKPGLMKPMTIEAGKSADVAIEFPIASPKLWNLDDPNLYTASVQIRGVDGHLFDSQSVPFGIRQFDFKADTGFWLNGKNIKLFGSALHHDAGGLGTAVPLSAWQRRLQLLKEVGCNAIRTSHNPTSPEFLDLCDRMGFLVMDEMFDCWSLPKTSLRGTKLQDYHLYFNDWWKIDVTDTLRRDRNHPSVILYSAGNEIHDINPNDDLGTREFIAIRDLMHQVDPTRPVTMAVLRPNQNNVYTNGFSELMDVVGQNYRERELLAAHAANPARKIIGTENHGELITWQLLRDNPAYSGQFLWTGFDYLGESTTWNAISHASGFYDRTGTKYGAGFQRQSWWTSAPMVQIAHVELAPPRPPDPEDPTRPREPGMLQLCDWTPTNLAPHDENLEIYSNCEQVELILDGKSLGTQARPASDAPRKWTVPFVPGEIKAIGSNRGQVVATCDMRTAEKPVRIALTVEQPSLPNDWDDVAYVRATVVDAHGTRVPSAEQLITFGIAGPGTIIAVDSGSLGTHESFRGNQRRTSAGSCVAIVRGAANAGKITISASAEGMSVEKISLDAAPPKNSRN
jgi:beta-galactosidase